MSPDAGRLVLVGTPIGNLGDLTPRAIERAAERGVTHGAAADADRGAGGPGVEDEGSGVAVVDGLVLVGGCGVGSGGRRRR